MTAWPVRSPSEAERRDMMLYGPCWTCGTAITAVATHDATGRVTRIDGACPTCDGVERQSTQPPPYTHTYTPVHYDDDGREIDPGPSYTIQQL